MKRLMILTLGLLTLSLPEPVRAGGGERYCFGGAEIIELWPQIPAGGLGWQIVAGPAALHPAPGFPARDPSQPLNTQPGFRSMIRAAASWTNAASGGASVTTFALTTLPTALVIANQNASGFASTISLDDGINTVTAWEPASTYVLFGGDAVLGFASVGIVLATGVITNCDIGMNTSAYSFVEEDSAGSLWYVTTDPNGFWTLPNWTPPAEGYAHMEGILAHEFGHLAGLGHSLVDCEENVVTGRRFPTMFFAAQVESFNPAQAVVVDANGAQTNVPAAGFLLGQPAATLEADDVSAVGDLYPSPAIVNQQLGSITGNVTDAVSGQAVLGAHVVAVRAQDPEITRVSTLAYANGAFVLRGLPLGTYYVYVEPVASPGYFPNDSLPNYVFQGFTGCTTIDDFVTEFWDQGIAGTGNEPVLEVSPMTATPVVLNAANPAAIRNFQVTGGTDILEVSRQMNTPSPRGARLPSATESATLQIDAPALRNQTVLVLAGFTRQSFLLNGELIQVPPVVLTSLMLNGGGRGTFPVPTGALAYSNSFYQVLGATPAGVQVASNVVNVWVAQP